MQRIDLQCKCETTVKWPCSLTEFQTLVEATNIRYKIQECRPPWAGETFAAYQTTPSCQKIPRSPKDRCESKPSRSSCGTRHVPWIYIVTTGQSSKYVMDAIRHVDSVDVAIPDCCHLSLFNIARVRLYLRSETQRMFSCSPGFLGRSWLLKDRDRSMNMRENSRLASRTLSSQFFQEK